MSTERLDSLIWLLIYGGMVLMALGFSLKSDDGVLGWAVAGVGALLVADGTVLIVVRSRMKSRP